MEERKKMEKKEDLKKSHIIIGAIITILVIVCLAISYLPEIGKLITKLFNF